LVGVTFQDGSTFGSAPIALSALCRPQAKVKAFSVGADDVVTKPFDRALSGCMLRRGGWPHCGYPPYYGRPGWRWHLTRTASPEQFRPDVPAGVKGWGAKGILDLRRIENAR
jgi:CheY-like chemotaxis protein